ncbi:hypothetical protein JVU11DRAFT_1618 [Chiua virens]|nr:hypothetical protein JVU11DRAFT_1618 [Chiua virens]
MVHFVKLYLDERHIDWMSDVVLQHVLADLRPLVIPKLQAEKDVHFDSRPAPGSKRGTVEVHRGGPLPFYPLYSSFSRIAETYQFAYFFRKTEPHTVLFKSRYFVTAPLHTEVFTKPTSSRLADRSSPPKARAPTKQSKRKRVKASRKGKNKVSFNDLDEDEWSAEETEENVDDTDPIPREARLIRKQRRIIYQEEENVDQADYLREDVMMDSPPPDMDEGSSGDPGLQAESHVSQDTAIEVDQSRMDRDHDAVSGDTTDRSMLAPDTEDIELVVEEEEKKPKPLLKLKYQSFHISGHCLCVVVEPWPPLRVPETRPQSISLGTSLQRASLESTPSGSVIAGQRAKTPLFLPEHDEALSDAYLTREKTRPPVPLFQDAASRIGDDEDDDYSDDDLMNFSQTLNAAGHMHTITADDDDDMDGAILFGDADEVRELL